MTDWILDITAWAQGAGVLGMVVMSLLFLVCAVLAVPASWPQMLLGFLYGPVVGVALTWPLTVLSGVLDAWLGRTAFRGMMSRRLERTGALLQRIDARLEARGFVVVLLMRLSPVSPFHIVSYALGLTRIRLRDIAVGTALGCIPPVLMYVVVGASITELARVFEGDRSGWTLYVAVLCTVAVAAGSTWLARRELAALQADAPGPEGGPSD